MKHKDYIEDITHPPVSDELHNLLKKMQTYFDYPINIMSGYPSTRWNRSTDLHYYNGMAVDITIDGISPAKIALYAQYLLGEKGGIECVCYATGGYVHIDMRPIKWRAIKVDVNHPHEIIYGDLFPSITKGSCGQSVVLMQRILTEYGFDCGFADGICGFRSREAIKEYQRSVRLDDDGICGPLTWRYLLGICKRESI